MTYIDWYLAPVPRENRAAYEELAKISAQIVEEHGALRVVDYPEFSNDSHHHRF